MSITATQLETLAELAKILAYTNETLHYVAKNSGNPQMAERASLAEKQCLDIEHHLRREAGLYEARENNDPFEAA